MLAWFLHGERELGACRTHRWKRDGGCGVCTGFNLLEGKADLLMQDGKGIEFVLRFEGGLQNE